MNAPPDRAEAERRQLVRDHLAQWRTRLYDRAAEWDLETVKHLVVLNAAGIAGVATLLGSSNPKLAGWAGPMTLMGYGIGVILAVLNLHLASAAFYHMGGEIDGRIESVFSPETPLDKRLVQAPKRGIGFQWAGISCGYTSAALAISSTALLGWKLLL